jgi:FMNH2-dependent dimethyl sulfone monooxygenase
MVATLDNISKGRFIFALGGGNLEREFKAYGLDWDDHDKLIERGREQLQIVKRLWTEDEVSFEGKYYQLERCIVEPKTFQKPHPPIFWGGSSRKSQEVAAELADGWFLKDGTPDEAKASVTSMQSQLKGRSIEIGIGCHFLIGDTDDKAREKLLGFVHGDQSLTDEVIQQGIVGSPATIVRRIKEYADAGMDYILLKPSPTLEGIEEYGEKVVPLLRDEGLM